MKNKVSIIINLLIFGLVLLATIFMFTGFKFMPDIGPKLEATGIEMLKFFTVLSNLFMGITALIFAIKKIRNKDISKRMYIFKLMATSSVFLTFFVVFAYLGPISKGGVKTLLVNSNLFYHLIVPVLSIITFILFEKTNKLTIKDSLYGIIPTTIYGIYYLINILVHIENGKVSTLYDWYWFVQKGLWTALIVIPVIFLISYLLSIVLWKFNKRL